VSSKNSPDASLRNGVLNDDMIAYRERWKLMSCFIVMLNLNFFGTSRLFFPGHQSFAAILERMSDDERVARLERGG
jgi:hypothetical protein